jgi:anti-sigma regulatory factor (Ser/Thr protein kinase)
VGGAITAPATFHHEALFYDGDDEFVSLCAAFAETGLELGEPVLVMAGSRKLNLLREALGEEADDVHFADMEVIGRNPARIIPAWRRFVAEHAQGDGGGIRGIGEPVWADRRADELTECQLHESLLNLAFEAAGPFRLICPYDVSTLPYEVIAEARRSHPFVSEQGEPRPSGDYCGIDSAAAGFSEPLPDPPAGAEEMRVTLEDLGEARSLVRRRARNAGVGERTDDLVLAVNEILSNSLHHARHAGLLRIWDEREGLVCEVRDAGRINHPLVGRVQPAAGQIGGHGIWLVNLVCDLVQVRSSEDGSIVRMKMSVKSG